MVQTSSSDKTLASAQQQFKNKPIHNKYQQSKVLKSIIAEYKQAFSRLEKYKQGLTEKDEGPPNNNHMQESSTTFSSLETQLGKNQVVKLNIGGEKYFTTTLTTLKSIPNTFFTGYFNEQFNPQPESIDNAYFIDRSSKYFELILSYLRGINIIDKIHKLTVEDLTEFIEEVVYYQLLPLYDLLPPKGKSILSTQYGRIELEKRGNVNFDPNYCSSTIVLESETRARGIGSDRSSVLGTKSNSFKVKLISNCTGLMIGFAPKSIDVNSRLNFISCGYYLSCHNGSLYMPNDEDVKCVVNKNTTRKINDESIVECIFDPVNRTISYKVNGQDYGSTITNVPSYHSELYPVCDIRDKGVFELVE